MNRYEQLMHNSLLSKLRIAQFLVALAIYTSLLLMPDSGLGGGDMKNFALHALGNCLLMLSTWTASGGRFKSVAPAIFVIPFSLFIELAQGLTDNRTPELIDIAANFCGVFVGIIACKIANTVIINPLKKIKVEQPSSASD